MPIIKLTSSYDRRTQDRRNSRKHVQVQDKTAIKPPTLPMSKYLSSWFDARTVAKLNSFVGIAREMTTSTEWSYADLTVGLSFYLLNEAEEVEEEEEEEVEDAIDDHGGGDGDGDGGETHWISEKEEEEEGDGDMEWILRNLEFWCYCTALSTLVNRLSLKRFLHRCHTELRVFPVIVRYEIAATTERNGYCLCVDHDIRSVLLLVNGTQTMQDLLTDMTASASLFMDGHYAHKGFHQAAKWFYQNLRYLIREKLRQYDGYSLRIVGHSAGAATASLLTLLMNDDDAFGDVDMHCLAIACPKVMSLKLASADKTKRLITSFVLNDDLVPRFSVEAFREFRPQLGDWETRFWASDWGTKLNALHAKAKSSGLIDVMNKVSTWYISKQKPHSDRRSGNSDGDDDDDLGFGEGDVEMDAMDAPTNLNSDISSETAISSTETTIVEVKRPVIKPPPSEFNMGMELYPAGRVVYIRTRKKPIIESSNADTEDTSQSPPTDRPECAFDEDQREEHGGEEILLEDTDQKQALETVEPPSESPDTPEAPEIEMTSQETKETPQDATSNSNGKKAHAKRPQFETIARVRLADPITFQKLQKLSKKTLNDHFCKGYNNALNSLMLQLLGKKPAYLVQRHRSNTPPPSPPPPPTTLLQRRDSAESSPALPPPPPSSLIQENDSVPSVLPPPPRPQSKFSEKLPRPPPSQRLPPPPRTSKPEQTGFIELPSKLPRNDLQ